MCTLACWVGVFPEAPLVVAANRDEQLGRPSSPPLLWPGEPRIVAPRDDLAGGSWWAVNEHGLFVALTNRAGANVDRHRRSRGLMLLEIARTPTLDAAEQALRSLTAAEYNGFHLLATDGRDAVQAINTAHTLQVERLGTGLHVLSERSFGADEVSRDARVRELFGPMSERPLDLNAIERVLSSHDEDLFQALCIHADFIHYGTRSSTVLAWGPSDRVLRYAPDAPCRVPYDEASALLKAL